MPQPVRTLRHLAPLVILGAATLAPTKVDAQAPVAAQAGSSAVGTYYSPELDIEYILSRDGGALRLRAAPGIDVEFLRVGPDTLTAAGLTLRFSREGGGVAGFEVDAGRVQHVAFGRRD